MPEEAFQTRLSVPEADRAFRAGSEHHLNGGEQWVHEGGIATGTVINEKGWQAVKSGAVATDTVVNTGAEGDRMQKMVIPGRPSTEMPYAPPSIKMVVRLWLLKER